LRVRQLGAGAGRVRRRTIVAWRGRPAFDRGTVDARGRSRSRLPDRRAVRLRSRTHPARDPVARVAAGLVRPARRARRARRVGRRQHILQSIWDDDRRDRSDPGRNPPRRSPERAMAWPGLDRREDRMFIIELMFKVDLARIDAHMAEHMRYLKKYYAAGN